MKMNLFRENYNKENNVDTKKDLDIYDECYFSYLDILKEKDVDIICKVVNNCKCCESVNFNTYYDKCGKCDGTGKLVWNGNEVTCNHCHGSKKVIKNKCPLCEGEGTVIRKGKVSVKLSKYLKDGDIITLKGNGKECNGFKGDLFIKVKINDLDRFKIVGNDVYDRKMIDFSKDDISKGVSKSVETIVGFAKVKSSNEEINEIVKLENQGIDNGDYYVCLNNELVGVKGNDVYKNVILNKEMLCFYLNREEMYSSSKCLIPYYFKKVNEDNFEYIELEDVNNFKIIKLKEKGLDGKHGGNKGDLYLRIFFDDEFTCVDDKLFSFPIKLNKYEVSDGKKILEFNKNKISLGFDKNLNEIKSVEIKDLGFMVDKNSFDSVSFIVNPFEYDVYKVSVKVNKKDKVIYLKDYKKYFYEEVKQFNEGLKIVLGNKKEMLVLDGEGNRVIVRIIR